MFPLRERAVMRKERSGKLSAKPSMAAYAVVVNAMGLWLWSSLQQAEGEINVHKAMAIARLWKWQ